MRLAAALMFALWLTACDDCNREGYEAMRVRLVSAEPAPPVMSSGCAVFTDLPTDTENPDQYGAALRHIGQSVYECLTGAATGTGTGTEAAFYDDRLWFRIDGKCPNSYYGCFRSQCSAIDTVLTNIGPPSMGCGDMDQWGETCWGQFYAVLGHEVMHGWLGGFHA